MLTVYFIVATQPNLDNRTHSPFSVPILNSGSEHNNSAINSLSGLVDKLNKTISAASGGISHALSNSGQDAINGFSDSIQNIISRIQAFFEQLLQTIESFIGLSTNTRKRRAAPELMNFLSGWSGRTKKLTSRLRTWMNNPDKLNKGKSFLRERRSALSDLENLVDQITHSVLPGALTNPIQFLSNLPNSIQGFSSDKLMKLLSELARAAWQFISKVAAPYTHRTLNELDSSISLPPVFHIMIQNYNVIYNLAKLLGYVS